MSASDCEEAREAAIQDTQVTGEFDDVSISCIDCAQEFVWTSGEQHFFYDKNLLNPPKRCKECKKAKNRRLEAIELSRVTGKRHRVEVRAECAGCAATTTVPFYPSQGRPVYCRACFIEMNSKITNGANSNL
jgi:CxxC-x17-CxxC domain-containing protein